MKLIKSYYEIITPINGEEILKQIELAARTCYKSEDKIVYEDKHDSSELEEWIPNYKAVSARPLVKMLIDKHHDAMLEFGGIITVKFVVDRGVSHELVRHRMASFAQESTRYCNYGNSDHITFIIPNWFSETAIQSCIGEHSPDFPRTSDWQPFYVDTPEETWFIAMGDAEVNYNYLIKCGWNPGQARSVLPNSLKTEINLSANIREWRHIFTQRVAKTAHLQMREVMCPLLDEFKSKIPILFDDINY
jgi:thymidylate synthase (FAD)